MFEESKLESELDLKVGSIKQLHRGESISSEFEEFIVMMELT